MSPEHSTDTFTAKKKGQLLKIHPQLLHFVAAQHQELGTAGAKGVCNQRQKEAELSGEKARSEPLDLHCTHGVHGSAAEKKDIRELERLVISEEERG